MVEVRSRVHAMFRSRVMGIKGIGEDLKWALVALWDVGEDGRLVRWE